MNALLEEIQEFLFCATPDSWVKAALEHQEVLLIDHANCEKKAASTALNLVYRYIEYPELLTMMSRLAREELRHFEQVLAIMNKRDITYTRITASRYAAELFKYVRKTEPEKLVDV